MFSRTCITPYRILKISLDREFCTQNRTVKTKKPASSKVLLSNYQIVMVNRPIKHSCLSILSFLYYSSFDTVRDLDASSEETGFKRTIEQNTPTTQRKQKIIMQRCILARKADCVSSLTGWSPIICLNTRVMMVMLHSIPMVRMVARKLDAIP